MLKPNQIERVAMSYARDEAIKIVEWALKMLSADETLCVEMPFLDVRRKADVAVVSPSRLSAIEIKGARDNTQTLGNQIADYRSMFLDVTIATVDRHLPRVRKLAPRPVGILLLRKDGVELIRKPIRRALLSPQSAAAWLSSSELSGLLGHRRVRAIGSSAARQFAAANIPARELSDLAVSSIAKRNEGRYAAFMRERGSASVDLDDLQMLALQQNIRR